MMTYRKYYTKSFDPTRHEAHIDLMQDGSLRFQSPYDAGLVAGLKAAIPHSDRQWDRPNKVWLVTAQYANALADLCQQHLGTRPDVPQVTVRAQTETKLIDLRYLGTAKERGSETMSFGWSNGGWTVIIPLAALHEWFSVETRPGEAATLYAVLGVKKTETVKGIKSAYHRAARQWHPDVCKDPDAGEQFRALKHAYEVLKDPLTRRKYNAGLMLAQHTAPEENKGGGLFVGFSTLKSTQKANYGWRPPLRCGLLMAEGTQTLGRFVVSKILQWEDVVNPQGQTLVTSWRYGDDHFQERWV